MAYRRRQLTIARSDLLNAAKQLGLALEANRSPGDQALRCGWAQNLALRAAHTAGLADRALNPGSGDA